MEFKPRHWQCACAMVNPSHFTEGNFRFSDLSGFSRKLLIDHFKQDTKRLVIEGGAGVDLISNCHNKLLGRYHNSEIVYQRS